MGMDNSRTQGGTKTTTHETTKVTGKGGSPMKGKFQTKARPGLKFTQPRRIPQLLTTGFSPLFSPVCIYPFPLLQIASTLGTNMVKGLI